MSMLVSESQMRDFVVTRDPRETMARLPEFLQVPLTLAIGKPLPGQKLPTLTTAQHISAYVAVHLAGIGISLAAAWNGGWWFLLLPIGWYLTTIGARHLQVGAVHHMTHSNFTRRPELDDALGRFLSLWLMIEDYDSYKRGHLKHHANSLSTQDDPTVQSLETAGLRNGMPVKALKARLLLCILSPLYHARIFARRCASYFRAKARWKPVALLLYLGGWAYVTFLFPPGVVLAWWIPMILAYQSASLVRAIIEHWPEEYAQSEGLAGYAEKTSAIFCGVPLPDPTGSLLRDTALLASWSSRMAFEIGCRFLFVSADGPNHDLHHLFPRSNWENDAALRIATDEKVRKLGIESLTETWGFWNTLELHLRKMSEVQPDPRP